MTTGTEGNDNLSNDPSVTPETVDALGGDDLITFVRPNVFSSIEEASVTVHGGSGTDTLHIESIIRSATPDADGGTIVLRHTSTYYTTIDYDGIENIYFRGFARDHEPIVFGATNDELHLLASSGYVNVSSGAGTDAIYLEGGFSTAFVDAGDGHDLIDASATSGSDSSPAYELDGGAGNDRIIGRPGHTDIMIGGTGDDAFWIEETGEQIVENPGEGTDKVFASIAYQLGANLENLQLIGGATVGEGNALNNVITGNQYGNSLYGHDGNDRLDGGAGADRLSGGNGDDIYYIDNAGDMALEAYATGGMDTVNSSVSYNLAYQHIERLFLTGTAAINATGNSLDNTLVGNSYDNVLDGGLGADVMNGGSGNDTYIVDNAGDVVIETSYGISQNYDTVRSSVTFYISEAYHIEMLVLTGTAAINGFGNSWANRIEGNSNNNVLNGGAGADTMIGHGGNDTYYVDDIYDRVFEDAGGGTADTVYSSVNFDLASKHVENLFLTGTADLWAWGNGLDNRIYGNDGNNHIDGRGGADYMNGGAGNDTYYVDHVGDRVYEGPGGGTDEIRSSVSFDLAGIHVERLLIISNSEVVTGTGNSLANTISVGGAAGSAARGLGGDDRLSGHHVYGGTGNDILDSYYGDTDRFFFDTALNASTNVDTIIGFSTVGYDQFQLSRAIFTAIDAGVLSEDAFHEGTAAADAEDRIVYNVQTGEVFYDADGSGAGAAILFARVDPGVQLDYFHFFAY